MKTYNVTVVSVSAGFETIGFVSKAFRCSANMLRWVATFCQHREIKQVLLDYLSVTNDVTVYVD